jgi:calcineurin-like phosphoesterase family protein
MYSDPHFGHHNVIDYCNRPYKNTDEMDEDLIRRFNERVYQGDTTIFMGDVFFCKYERAKDIMTRLNGTKILVKGNHDMSANTMYKIGFDFVCEQARIKIGKTYVNLSHYSYKRNPWNHWFLRLFNKKYRSKLHFRKLRDDGEWLCHGHSHSKEKLKDKMIHVGVDAWNYYPVSFPEISAIIDMYENPIKKHSTKE